MHTNRDQNVPSRHAQIKVLNCKVGDNCRLWAEWFYLFAVEPECALLSGPATNRQGGPLKTRPRSIFAVII